MECSMHRLLLFITGLAFILALTRCGSSIQQDPLLERALILAGSNRQELEFVLDHYAHDSLALESAKFLIRNMPGHYSYADTITVGRFYDAIDSLVRIMKGQPNEDIQHAINTLYKNYNAHTFSITQDVRVISAKFLIDNIDKAIKQWKELPWCNRLNFDQFCEYILPYKTTELQELKPWRDSYNQYYGDSLERISSCSLYRISSFEAAITVNNCLRQYFIRDRYDYEIPALYFRPLSRLAIPFATCDELCNSGLTAFRAAGIPVAIDFVYVWGYGNRGHSWCVVNAPNGHDLPFVPIDTSPNAIHKVNETVGKAYRRTYAANPDLVELNNSGQLIPEPFRDIFQRDVTYLYADCRNITINIDMPDGSYVYLCNSSRAQWKPTAFAKVKSGKAIFNNIGKGCIYAVASYSKDGLKIIINPFKIERNGDFIPIMPNYDKKISATFYRKAPLLEYAWRQAVKSETGVFEASNDATFCQKTIIGHVNTPADRAGEITIENRIPFRYWRYTAYGKEADCSIGDVSLIKNNIVINKLGKVITNIKSVNNISTKPQQAFDGDVLTSVSFKEQNAAWVGIDFGKPVNIDKIRYFPRSDGNMIEAGDNYELLFWNDSRWISLGCKIVSSVSITFNDIPSDALYLLLNRTKGNSVRIFMLDNAGHQEWW